MSVERQHYAVTLAILTVAATAYAVQQTLVFPALPTLQREFGTSAAWVTWVMTAFLLSASVLTPIFGKLGDRFGKERLLVVSLCLFLAGSLGAAAAPDLWTLIAFRVVSGAGGAVFPLSFGIIRDEFPPERVKVGIGLLSAVFGVGSGLGLIVSGLVIDNLSWRWLFIIGAAPVALVIVVVRRFVPESPVRSLTRLDVPGAALLSGALISLLLALTEGERWGWTSSRIIGLLGVAAALAGVWIVVELRSEHPMVDMRLMTQRSILLTNVTAVISGFALFGSFILVPQYVESPRGLPGDISRLVDYGFGATATRAGLLLLPSSAMMLFAGPVAGVLGRRFGSKWPLAAGMALNAAGAAMLAHWNSRPWQIAVAMLALGIGIGFSFAAMAALITENVPITETGVATGMNTVMRTVGGVIGAQVAAAVLTASTIPGTDVPSRAGFDQAFMLAAGAAAIGAVVGLFVTRFRPRGRHSVSLAIEND